MKINIFQNQGSSDIPRIQLPPNLSTESLKDPKLVEVGTKFFEANGTLQIDNLFSKDLVDGIHDSFRQDYSSYFQDRDYADSLKVGDRRRMITLELKNQYNEPQLYGNVYLMNLMRNLLGKDFILGSYGVVIALPGAEHQHIHRDHPALFPENEAINLNLPSFCITAVIPLTELTPETGSTRVWKGSHRYLDSRDLPETESAVPYMPTGSCYLMDYQLYHGGTPNISKDIVRPILYVIYYRSWFREAVNYDRQSRLIISPEEYAKVPDIYRFLFAGMQSDVEVKGDPRSPRAGFSSLSHQEQANRLELVAKSALSRYGLNHARLELIQHTDNTTFQVQLPTAAMPFTPERSLYADSAYLLRVHRADYLRDGEIASELDWLKALRRDIQLPVPEPMLTLKGKPWNVVKVPGVPGNRICTITRWLNGRGLPSELDDPQLEAVGATIAKLHHHAQQWQAPATFERPRWNWEELFGQGAGLSRDDGEAAWAMIPEQYRSQFKAVSDRTRALMTELGEDPAQFGLIHSDLCPANWVVTAEGLGIIDFADCGYGYWGYDIAVFLSYYADEADFPRYKASLLRGYEAVRHLPNEQAEALDDFIAAQWVVIALWRAHRAQDTPHFQRILEESLEEAAANLKALETAAREAAIAA